jgi:hypothetical protein
MTAHLPKDFWRKAYGHLSRLLPPGNPLRSPEDIVEVNGLLDVCREQQAIAATRVERGRKILEWRIPAALAPTMNAYAFMKNWQRMKLRRELDDRLRRIVDATPGARVHGDATKRWVRVTRFTPNASTVDDLSADALGGKLPIDALVRVGVLVDDRPALCHREALVRPTTRGNTHVLIECFDVANEEVPDGGPHDGPVEQVPKRKGKLTKAIEDG